MLHSILVGKLVRLATTNTIFATTMEPAKKARIVQIALATAVFETMQRRAIVVPVESAHTMDAIESSEIKDGVANNHESACTTIASFCKIRKQKLHYL